MMLVRCSLQRSPIEGLGVVAEEPVAAGDVVWRFDRDFDLLVPLEKLARAGAATQEFFARFAFEIEGFPDCMALDGDDGRFMNHSDAPNLDFSYPGVATATRDIALGEEFTCDYHKLASRPFSMQPPRALT